MATIESMTYVAKAPCGCVKMAVLDTPEMNKEAAAETSRAIRQGYAIERVTSQWVRTESVWGCDECKPKK